MTEPVAGPSWREQWRAASDDAARVDVVIAAIRGQSVLGAARFLDEVGVFPAVSEVDPRKWREFQERSERAAYAERRGLDPFADFSGTGREPGPDDEDPQFIAFQQELAAHLYAKTPGMDYWLSWSDISRQKVSLLVGVALAYATTGSVTIATLGGVISATGASIKKMSDDELEIFALLARLGDGDPYTRWVSVDELLAAMPDDGGERHQREVLASMAGRGIVKESAGLWRAVK